MPNIVLDRRTLNRALLDRQLLLERSEMSALEVIEYLVGMQSQAPDAPYVGLWTRLKHFSFAELAGLMTERRAVRIVLMRGTVHLVSASDALALRPLVQPMLDRQFRSSTWSPGVRGVDREELVAAGRALVGERARNPAELRAALGERWPQADPGSLVNALRNWIPLVQLPPRGVWGKGGQPVYATVEEWLGRTVESPDVGTVVRRYLGAFGPAGVADLQKWSGLTGLRQVVAGLELRTYRDDQGRVLYDLPDAGLPDPDTPAPARFVADFDNLVLSHADRSRILGEVAPGRVMTVNGIVRGTVLVDGFVGGTWKFERRRGEAAVLVEPFGRIGIADREALEAEGSRLLAATDPQASAHAVRFTGS